MHMLLVLLIVSQTMREELPALTEIDIVIAKLTIRLTDAPDALLQSSLRGSLNQDRPYILAKGGL